MNYLLKSFTFSVIAVLLVVTACKKKEYQTIEELDQENIQAYIQKNNLDVEPFGETGMFYQILEGGTGKELNYEERTPLVYSIKTLDNKFSSLDTFSVSNRYYDYLGYFPYGSAQANAPGSPLENKEGMKVILKEVLKNSNGKVRIIVPSRLAFGRDGTKLIPSNASLDYVIHAIDIDSLSSYEEESIKQYIKSNSLVLSDFQRTTSGVYYKIVDQGSGESISDTTSIKVSYGMKLLNGNSVTTVDSAATKLSSNTAIDGWKEVLPKLKANGKVRMLIPSAEAYGLKGIVDENNIVRVPPFSPLDYDLQVVHVTKPAN